MNLVGHLRVVVEPMLDWQVWRLASPPTLVLGRESYPQFVFALTVKPSILDTDPGPLDARVP